GVVDASLPLGAGHGASEAEPVLARLAVTRKLTSEPIEPHWRRRARQVVPYLAVIAATVAATLLVQVIIGRWLPASGGNQQSVEVDPPASYLATLTGAELENNGELRQSGSRLLPGEVHLKKGVARIQFDSGAVLVAEGPTTLHLESIAEASLVLGKVAFRAD